MSFELNNNTLSRATEGTGPVMSGNLLLSKVLIPADSLSER